MPALPLMQRIKEVKPHLHASSIIFFDICILERHIVRNPTQTSRLITLCSFAQVAHKSSLDHVLEHLYPSSLAY
jgi:hypothetical protein